MLYRPYQAYDSVDRTLLWTALARFGVSQIMILVVRQFYDGMRACVRLADRVCSRWFAVEQGLRQGCVLAPLPALTHIIPGRRQTALVTPVFMVTKSRIKILKFFDKIFVPTFCRRRFRNASYGEKILSMGKCYVWEWFRQTCLGSCMRGRCKI